MPVNFDKQTALGTKAPVPPVREGATIVTLAVGLALVVLGALLLLQQLTDFDLWLWSWPFFVIVPGVLLLAVVATSGRGTSALAIPGSILTTIGVILLFQNTFNLWQTWAYVWTLIPASVGAGLWLHGLLGDQPDSQLAGRRLVTIGLVMFLAFGVFFELVLNLSGMFSRDVGGIVVSLLLLLGGVYLLLRSGHRSPSV